MLLRETNQSIYSLAKAETQFKIYNFGLLNCCKKANLSFVDHLYIIFHFENSPVLLKYILFINNNSYRDIIFVPYFEFEDDSQSFFSSPKHAVDLRLW